MLMGWMMKMFETKISGRSDGKPGLKGLTELFSYFSNIKNMFSNSHPRTVITQNVCTSRLKPESGIIYHIKHIGIQRILFLCMPYCTNNTFEDRYGYLWTESAGSESQDDYCVIIF